MTKAKSRNQKRGRKVRRSKKTSRKRRNNPKSRKRNIKRSRKIYGGTKKIKKVNNKSRKIGVKSNKIKKEPSVTAKGWTLYSGPNAESTYPSYFKRKEFKKVEKDHKKVQEDLAAAEYLHSKRPQPQSKWSPSTLPPPEIELQMRGF